MRPSSLEEYASWYLRREARKASAPVTPAETSVQVQAMCRDHSGKMRDWFGTSTRWGIVELEPEDLADLVFLECPWTMAEGLVVPGGSNYRVLRRVAANAIASGYLSRPSAHKHLSYYQQLSAGTLHLTGEDRIAICSAESSETSANPDASYYLLDGVGRCLPYMMLVAEQHSVPVPIEAFVAEREA